MMDVGAVEAGGPEGAAKELEVGEGPEEGMLLEVDVAEGGGVCGVGKAAEGGGEGGDGVDGAEEGVDGGVDLVGGREAVGQKIIEDDGGGMMVVVVLLLLLDGFGSEREGWPEVVLIAPATAGGGRVEGIYLGPFAPVDQL